MTKPAKQDQDVAYWESGHAIEKYLAPPVLLRGERAAFAACFSDGLAGRSVLDLGCGGGRTTGFLAQLGAEVTGMDISQNLIRAAQGQYPNIPFCVGDAQALPYDNDRFDAVLFSFNGLDCLHPKSSRVLGIEEVRRVLRPEGKFIVSHHNQAGLMFAWYKSMRPRKLRRRISNIVNGNAFRRECYIREQDSGGVHLYYTWPSIFIEEMGQMGFNYEHIFPNAESLGLIQRTLGTSWLTRLADPWPYYVLVKQSD